MRKPVVKFQYTGSDPFVSFEDQLKQQGFVPDEDVVKFFETSYHEIASLEQKGVLTHHQKGAALKRLINQLLPYLRQIEEEGEE